jgi:hypothetical protein
VQDGIGEGSGERSLAPLRVSRKRLAIMVGVLALIVVVIVAIVLLVGGGDDAPGEAEVSRRVAEAITAASSTTSGQPTGTFDTRALRGRLENELDGWRVDLAASEDSRRIGVAVRRLSDSLCVFAWSDVGGPQTATVSDIRLPCLAVMALQAAKNPV